MTRPSWSSVSGRSATPSARTVAQVCGGSPSRAPADHVGEVGRKAILSGRPVQGELFGEERVTAAASEDAAHGIRIGSPTGQQRQLPSGVTSP